MCIRLLVCRTQISEPVVTLHLSPLDMTASTRKLLDHKDGSKAHEPQGAGNGTPQLPHLLTGYTLSFIPNVLWLMHHSNWTFIIVLAPGVMCVQVTTCGISCWSCRATALPVWAPVPACPCCSPPNCSSLGPCTHHPFPILAYLCNGQRTYSFPSS